MICFSTTTELQCWDVVEKLLKLKISLTHQEFCEYVNSDFIGLWKNLQDDISNTFPSSWTTSCMARFWSGELSISLNEKTKNKQTKKPQSFPDPLKRKQIEILYILSLQHCSDCTLCDRRLDFFISLDFHIGLFSGNVHHLITVIFFFVVLEIFLEYSIKFISHLRKPIEVNI